MKSPPTMFRRLLFRKSKSSALLNSKLFCDKSFYSAFISDLKHSRSEVLIESPFIANNCQPPRLANTLSETVWALSWEA